MIPWGKDLFGVLIKMKKRYKILLGLLSAVVLYKGYHYWLYTPRTNKHPKYFVTISGTVDRSALPADFNYTIRMQYFTTKQRCLETINWFEGVAVSRVHDVYYYPHIEKNGHYQIKIPIDRMSTGYCDWRAEGLVLSFQPKKKAEYTNENALALVYCKPFINSEDLMSGLSPNCTRHFDSTPLWVECDKQRCDYEKHQLVEQALSPNRSYSYRINFVRKKYDNNI